MTRHLFEPLTFRNGTQARNRTALAAMTNSQSNADGTLHDDELQWLIARAQGGFGIITTCASHVSRDGQGWIDELACFDDVHIPGLTRLAQSMHQHGALAFLQIFHGGLRADSALTGEPAWSSSASEDGATRAATHVDIERVIGDFAAAARRAQRAGFDGVEIHGAHGYLLTQFMSRTENRRTDEWGGSLENRARLNREVMRAVRAAAPELVVGVRISPEDFGNAKGLDLDENLQLAQWLCEDGADFVHVSLWDVSLHTTKRPPHHALTLFRAALPPDVRIQVAGKIWAKEDADRALVMGADGVALGRAAITNPDWPLRVTDPAWVPQRPPLTEAELAARGVSSRFARYMRKWKDFVKD